LNKKYFFGEGVSFISRRSDELKATLIHELAHVKDNQNIVHYKQSLDLKNPRLNTICRLMIATENMEEYTKTESSPGNLHDYNPKERRAVLIQNTYNGLLAKVRGSRVGAAIKERKNTAEEKQNLEPKAKEKTEELVRFSDALYDTFMNGGKINPNNENYNSLGDHYKKMAQKYAQQPDFQHHQELRLLERLTFSTYTSGIFNFIWNDQDAKRLGIKAEYFDPESINEKDPKSGKTYGQEWQENFSADDRKVWQEKVREKGINEILHHSGRKLNQLIFEDVKSENERANGKRFKTVQAIDPSKARDVLDRNSKRVALREGAPVKPLNGAVNYAAADGLLKGRVVKTLEATLTASPVPEFATAAVTHKQSLRVPGVTT